MAIAAGCARARLARNRKDREPSQAFANCGDLCCQLYPDFIVTYARSSIAAGGGLVLGLLGEDADEPLVIAPIVGICADLVIGAYAGKIQLDHEILTRGSARCCCGGRVVFVA